MFQQSKYKKKQSLVWSDKEPSSYGSVTAPTWPTCYCSLLWNGSKLPEDEDEEVTTVRCLLSQHTCCLLQLCDATRCRYELTLKDIAAWSYPGVLNWFFIRYGSDLYNNRGKDPYLWPVPEFIITSCPAVYGSILHPRAVFCIQLALNECLLALQLLLLNYQNL